jgi:formylglycine-generating enzyme required for sulfatase activity
MAEGRRTAILIAASEFPEEPSLQTLRCPKNDVVGLAEALTSPDFGLFTDPPTFINEPSHSTLRAINRVFKEAGRDDQILIYYSGHGKQDGAGNLYLATSDTEADALETSSIAVGTLRRLIDNYACKQVALVLDCCFGGAVSKDFLKGGVDDHLKQTFHGRGIYILTASTATQTAREKEGDDYSLFTKHILQGIRQGEADHDDDGLISLDDLYEYVKIRVPKEAPQHPTKWEFGVQGNSLFIARAVRTFNPDRLRAFREKIISVDDYLPLEVFDHAYKVIRENQPKRDIEFLALLEALCEERMTIGEFSSRWLKAAPADAPEEEKKAQGPQQDKEARAQPHAVWEARRRQLLGGDQEKKGQGSPVVTTPPPRKKKTPPRLQKKKAQTPPPVIATPPQEKKAPPDKPVKSFTENLNGVPLKMIFVPGGSFKMGSPGGTGHDNERPQRDVIVPAFYIGKYLITQGQWGAVMGKNPSYYDYQEDSDLPVEEVSWNDTKRFCKKLSQMTGKQYCLPSEAEWEYACRAGATGDHAGELGAMAWYAKDIYRRTQPVGNKRPNAFGLYDMHGNVWEWCEDAWHDSYENAPTDGSAWLRGGDSSRRVVRGGSWGSGKDSCRSAYRYGYERSYHNNSLGVRVVVSVGTLTP